MPSAAKTKPRTKSAPTKAAKGSRLGALPEWNLADLYPAIDDPAVARDLARAEADCIAFEEAYKGKLAAMAAAPDAGATLAEALKRYEAIDDLIGRLGSFAGLTYAGNTTDPKRAKFYGDTQERITAASLHMLFFELELNRVDDAAIERAMTDPALGHYRPWIEDVRKGKPYQLEDRVEELFHEKSVTGAGAWNRLFDETMASLRFEVDDKKLPLEQTLTLMQDANEKKRKAAAQALAKTFRENLRTFTLITNTLAKDKEISDRWRGFKDIADARHLSNRVEPEVVEALVAAVRAAYPRLSHRYYALKARWFGKKKLPHWDRNAPLPQVPQRTIGWDEARDTVLTAYAGFSPRMAEVAERFFSRRWIDAPARPGKQGGAFSHPTVPSAHPYVLMNYQGKPRDVMTLAHELGHGVHQVLAAPNGALMAPTPLTLAETASVFGEMLTFKKLLAETRDVRARRAMLAAKVEDMINTVVRQIAFYTYERKVHTERRNGELTADQLCAIWMSVQAESLGPAIELKPGYETFWTYIPHFIHSPFYVYAYAFGDCMVNSLYAVYEKASAGFAERYLAMLAAGGTKHHSELLAPFGLDARDPAFWQGGLSVIERMIKELETIDRAH
jgi:oligoendopeptidase F